MSCMVLCIGPAGDGHAHGLDHCHCHAEDQYRQQACSLRRSQLMELAGRRYWYGNGRPRGCAGVKMVQDQAACGPMAGGRWWVREELPLRRRGCSKRPLASSSWTTSVAEIEHTTKSWARADDVNCTAAMCNEQSHRGQCRDAHLVAALADRHDQSSRRRDQWASGQSQNAASTRARRVIRWQSDLFGSKRVR